MMFIFLLISLAIVGFVALAAQHRTVRIFAAFYYLVQAGFAAAVIPFRIGEVESQFFTFDLLGAIFFVLMAVICGGGFRAEQFLPRPRDVAPVQALQHFADAALRVGHGRLFRQ